MMRKSLLLCIALVLFISPITNAYQNDCETGFRAYFKPPTGMLRRLQVNVRRALKKKIFGKDFQDKVSEKLLEYRKQREAYAEQKFIEAQRKNNGGEVPDVETFKKEFDEQLGHQIVFDGRDMVNELAYGALINDTFEGGLHEFLENYGDFHYKLRFKIFARLWDMLHKVNTLGKEGRTSVTFDRARITMFFDIITLGLFPDPITGVLPKSIEIPAGKFVSLKDFHAFLTEVSTAMFTSVNPEPNFNMTWMQAMYNKANYWGLKDGTVEYEALGFFKDESIMTWRKNFRAYIEDQAKAFQGEVDPELAQQMYEMGLSDGVGRWIVDKTWGALKRRGIKKKSDIKNKAQLKELMEDLKKDPEYLKDVEKASLTLNFYIRPVMMAMALGYTQAWIDAGPSGMIEKAKNVLTMLDYFYDRIRGRDPLAEQKKHFEEESDYWAEHHVDKYSQWESQDYKDAQKALIILQSKKAAIEAHIKENESRLKKGKTSPGDEEKLKKEIYMLQHGPKESLDHINIAIQRRRADLEAAQQAESQKSSKKTKRK